MGTCVQRGKKQLDKATSKKKQSDRRRGPKKMKNVMEHLREVLPVEV